METTRIKMKIGEHEFEAEGPVDAVAQQFVAFKEMISNTALIIEPPKNDEATKIIRTMDILGAPSHVPIEKILHMAGRVVSLTALPASTTDSALLIMLGHKDLRNNLSVTGQEIGDGLAQSGRPVQRVDRIMDKAMEEALVLKTGIKRGTRYRLTNQGLSKALTIARELIASLP